MRGPECVGQHGGERSADGAESRTWWHPLGLPGSLGCAALCGGGAPRAVGKEPRARPLAAAAAERLVGWGWLCLCTRCPREEKSGSPWVSW